MQYDITTAPTAEWITTTEAREYLRQTDQAEEMLLTGLITYVRVALEMEIGRSLLTQTVTLWLDADETRMPLWLPLPPAAAITSVTGYDEAGNASVVSSANYRLTSLDPGRLYEVDATEGWSSAVDRTFDGLKVVYTAGYGATSASIPGTLLLVLRQRLARAFVHRGLPVVGTIAAEIDLPDLLSPYTYRLAL